MNTFTFAAVHRCGVICLLFAEHVVIPERVELFAAVDTRCCTKGLVDLVAADVMRDG